MLNSALYTKISVFPLPLPKPGIRGSFTLEYRNLELKCIGCDQPRLCIKKVHFTGGINVMKRMLP